MPEKKISKIKKNEHFVFMGRNIIYRYIGKKSRGFFHYINPANEKEYKTKYDCVIFTVNYETLRR